MRKVLILIFMFLELLFGDFFCIAQEKESSFITLKSSYQVPKDAVDANEMKVWDLFDLFMKRLETNEELKLLLKLDCPVQYKKEDTFVEGRFKFNIIYSKKTLQISSNEVHISTNEESPNPKTTFQFGCDASYTNGKLYCFTCDGIYPYIYHSMFWDGSKKLTRLDCGDLKIMKKRWRRWDANGKLINDEKLPFDRLPTFFNEL